LNLFVTGHGGKSEGAVGLDLMRGAAVYPVEVDGQLFDLMERFGGLRDTKTGDRQAVATALGRLLRRALEALLREEAAPRR
jgi:hypothetical protein